MELKVNIGHPKKGQTLKKVYSEEDAKAFIGKKIGMKIKGDLVGYPGYEFEITGGSDYCGFPMRKDVTGIARKKVLVTKGFGNKKAKRKGLRYRRNVAGNTVYSKTAQLNLKVLTEGKAPLFEDKKEEQTSKASPSSEKEPPKEEAKPEAKADAPKEEAKAAPTEEVKKEEPKEEKKEAPKEEAKPEAKEKPKDEPKKEQPKEEKKEAPKEKPAEKKEEAKPEAKEKPTEDKSA